MNYEALRHFADSYALVAMVVVWLTFAGWAFRPGARERNHEAANMIFKDDDHG
jgi:cytochrome c oxidase cbb3-type subunit 4